jgi:hypothetical protein
MCNLYSTFTDQAAMRAPFGAELDRLGNWQSQSGIFPDYAAPIVRNSTEGRELTMARWGMPSPRFALMGKKSDPGVTNIRDTKSPHWRRWLGKESHHEQKALEFEAQRLRGQVPYVYISVDRRPFLRNRLGNGNWCSCGDGDLRPGPLSGALLAPRSSDS